MTRTIPLPFTFFIISLTLCGLIIVQRYSYSPEISTSDSFQHHIKPGPLYQGYGAVTIEEDMIPTEGVYVPEEAAEDSLEMETATEVINTEAKNEGEDVRDIIAGNRV